MKTIQEINMEVMDPIIFGRGDINKNKRLNFLLDESSERFEQLSILVNSLYSALWEEHKRGRFLICSTFYSPAEVIIGIISSYNNIPISRIQTRTLSQNEYEIFERTWEKISSFNLWITDSDFIDSSILEELKINRLLDFKRNSLDIEIFEDYYDYRTRKNNRRSY